MKALAKGLAQVSSRENRVKTTLQFLRELSEHNDRTWFNAHRDEYERARHEFGDFVQTLIFRISDFDPLDALTADDCIFRIHRDVRFAADKRPFKTNMGAAIRRGGRRSVLAPYYLHIEPEGSFFGGGLHQPSPAELAKLRATIDADAGQFDRVLTAPAFFDYFGPIQGEKLRSSPRNYSKDHPAIELLRHTSMVAARNFSDDEVLAPDFTDRVVDGCRRIKPFLDLLNRVISLR
jgi:uncharacterized protein (TIGR02453 family)